MYLHIGDEKDVLLRDVIAVLNLDTVSISDTQKGKSAVITKDCNKTEIEVFYSSVSSDTIKKRSERVRVND